MSAIGKGDFVECVDMSPVAGFRWHTAERLVVGQIYQVGDCWEDPWDQTPVISIVGHERVGASADWGRRVGYAAARFKPVYTPKSETFNSLLQPTPEREREEA